ncbi:DUF5107 domain-containing protein [Chryseolinea lacunae]|uniref:DUF5107 domain-containing protein n=1 Tax=Chryseolinea lacunae TaxID=2801331 RepID=A0ABS1L194_9BACT|nr:DUF5107 domain-containing protein [Chryseolinea lacunae]MBL0745298.1 DUF5107 domain-containing protein [Chryseolinea lacunae]
MNRHLTQNGHPRYQFTVFRERQHFILYFLAHLRHLGKQTADHFTSILSLHTRRSILLLHGLLLLAFAANAQQATVTETEMELLTYAFSEPNPVPILTERNNRIYPYHTFDGYATEAKKQKWNVVKLENEFIEVYILPQAGGKVWGAIEKSTGKEFIYRNEVMKFRNIAMRGPWTSGGIEFNFGYIGHSPATSTPVDYTTQKNADGSVSCFVGNIDLPSRTQWRVEIRLPKDKAFFETHATWSNPTPLPQSYYNWMTGAAVVSDDLEFFYPGNQELGHDGANGPWPVDPAGRDISKYVNSNFGSHRSSHIVGEYTDFMGGYYHKSNFGFGHWALYNDMPGHKLWLWALSRNGGIWEDLLTDSDGQYMEFQAGRMFNQFQASSLRTPITQVPFAPNLTDRWSELWFPVKTIGGLSDVSPSGVLHVTRDKSTLTIGINALSNAQAKLVVLSGGKTIHTETKALKPMEVFQTTVTLPADAPFDVLVEGMDLRYSSENKNLIKRPFASTFKADPTSAAYLYYEGMEEKESRNYSGAKTSFLKCLAKDPQYIDALAALTELHYRSHRYDSALHYATLGLQLDAYDPSINYFAGVSYRAQGDLLNALETFGWAARSPEYRSAALAQMAAIEVQRNDLTLAEKYAQQSLDFNRYNFSALSVLSAVYRIKGQAAEAGKIVDTMLSFDPLNHLAAFEGYLLQETPARYDAFAASIKNEFPYQTFLEIAIHYNSLGRTADALRVLEKSPAHSLVHLWQAYLKKDTGALAGIAAESAAFVFPFRSETVDVLLWAKEQHAHWKFTYYLALNYWGIQRDKDAIALFQSCGQQPDFAPFYASRAFLLKRTNSAQAKADLERAQQLAPTDWRNWAALIEHYEQTHDYPKMLSLSLDATKKFKGNSSLGLSYAKALLHTGNYANSVKVLEGMIILPFEGSSDGKTVYEQAYMLWALELMDKKKFADAIVKIEKSKAWPESLGVGKPYDADTRMQDYAKAYCLKKLNKLAEAEALLKAVLDYSQQQPLEPNFNNILPLWIFTQRHDAAAADAWKEKLAAYGSQRPPHRWVVASATNDTSARDTLAKSLESNPYFTIIQKLQHLVF